MGDRVVIYALCYPVCLEPILEPILEVSDCLDIKCPIQYVVELLDHKWSILVLRELFAGDRRTHELLAALPGISTKTLTQDLRKLESQGLVERRVYAEIPPRVEYSLTPKGRQIQPVMVALHQVGSQWLDQRSCACSLTQQDAEPSNLRANQDSVPTDL